MVRFLSVLLTFFSTSANALTISGAGVGTVTVCGMVLSTTNLIHVTSRACSSNNRSSMWRAGDTASAYSAGKGTVGGSNAANGKAFRISVAHFTVTTAGGANTGPEFWYADNDVGFNSAGTFTNGVNFVGQTGGNGYMGSGINATSANNTMDQNIQCVPFLNWLIPNGKFPSVKSDGTACMTVDYYGYEE